jgi:hypothetical protein
MDIFDLHNAPLKYITLRFPDAAVFLGPCDPSAFATFGRAVNYAVAQPFGFLMKPCGNPVGANGDTDEIGN